MEARKKRKTTTLMASQRRSNKKLAQGKVRSRVKAAGEGTSLKTRLMMMMMVRIMTIMIITKMIKIMTVPNKMITRQRRQE